jgi:hypothetical protein
MMNSFLLAQAGTSQASQDLHAEALAFIWQQITDLSWLHAVMAISMGIVYMLYGWRIFRVLVVICFGLAGMFLGIFAGRHFGSTIWGGIVGLAVFAVVSVPLMKWCVSVLGAVAGGSLTGAAWYAFGLPLDYIWAGVIIGLVAGGLMSFILLKVSVMLFTGLGGSVIMMVGVLSLLYQYESKVLTPPTQHIHDYVHYSQWFLPVVIIVPTLLGMIVQHRFIKQSQEWEI